MPEGLEGGLRRRLLSALVIGPLALVAIYVGGGFFHGLLAAVAAVLAWEWDRLCGGRFGASGVTLGAVGVLIVAAAAFARFDVALYLSAAGAVAAAAAAYLGRHPRPLWMAAGALYVGLPLVATDWLRADPDWGRATLLWLVLAVAATDMGAYLTGRGIGGPRLAPRISPGKTWAGLAGGMVAATLVGGLAAWAVGGADPLLAAALGLVLALVSQAGDLAESAIKRHFGVKNSSALIPGHGGLFDRLDGLLVAVPVVAAASLLSGRQVLTW